MIMKLFTVCLFAATAQAVALTADSQIDAQLLASESVTDEPDITCAAETASKTDVDAEGVFPAALVQACKIWNEATGCLTNGKRMAKEFSG